MIAYAITDPSTLNFERLEGDLKRFYTKSDIIVYRDKNNKNYKRDATLFIKEARKYPFKKILLHTDFQLAIDLKADGVHLTSQQLNYIDIAKKSNLFVVVSTHNQKEALYVEELGADMITYSPIFKTPNKGEPIGINALNELSKIINIPIIALGGIITKEDIESCRDNGAYGFASIRYFKR